MTDHAPSEAFAREQAGRAARGKDHAAGTWCRRFKCTSHPEPTPVETPGDFEIPEEAVEDVAKAIYEAPHDGLSRKGYDAAPRDIQDLYRAEARLALAAALPHLRAHQIEVQTRIGYELGRKEALAEVEAAIKTERLNPVRGWNHPDFGDMNAQMYHDATEMCERIVRDFAKGTP